MKDKRWKLATCSKLVVQAHPENILSRDGVVIIASQFSLSTTDCTVLEKVSINSSLRKIAEEWEDHAKILLLPWKKYLPQRFFQSEVTDYGMILKYSPDLGPSQALPYGITLDNSLAYFEQFLDELEKMKQNDSNVKLELDLSRIKGYI